MSVNVCYHRIRISVKLTCDKMCGSVGAGGERVVTAAGAQVGQHAGSTLGACSAPHAVGGDLGSSGEHVSLGRPSARQASAEECGPAVFRRRGVGLNSRG